MTNNAKHMEKLAYELANRPVGLVVVETGFLTLIALAAFISNSCVLYVFYKTPSLQTITSYYLIALAVADIIKSVVTMPASIASSACGRDVLGHSAGEALHWVHALVFISSMAISMLIAINRYFCVNKPDKYRKYFKPKFVKLSLVACGLLAVPLIIVSLTDEKPLIEFHYGWLMYVAWSPDQTTNTVFSVFFELIMVVIPASLSIYCYWKVYKKMTNHIAAVAPTLVNGSTLTIEEVNVTRSLTALVVGCAVFWLPNSILYHLDWYVPLPRYVGMIYTCLFFMFSVVSPVLYNVFNKSFRRKFLALFVCQKHHQKKTNEQYVMKTTKLTGVGNSIAVSTAQNKS